MAETAAVAGLSADARRWEPVRESGNATSSAATPATPPVAAWKAARPAFTAMAVGALNTMMLTRVQVRFGRYLSRRYMTGVLDREFPFFVNRSSGDLIYRANLVMVVEQIVTGSLPSTVVSMVFLVVYLIMMIAYSAPLTMLTLTVCAAVLVVSVIYSLRNRTLVERATVAQADVQRAFIETFSGIVGVISQIMAFATYMRKICEMIPAGEGDKIAIVGPTGSGKSTLLKLLAGLIEPVCGTVTINDGGCRIYDADSRWKADRLAYVHQESTVFNETLRDNITLHRPWLTDDDIVRACEVAGINEGMMDPVVGRPDFRLYGRTHQCSGQRYRATCHDGVARLRPMRASSWRTDSHRFGISTASMSWIMGRSSNPVRMTNCCRPADCIRGCTGRSECPLTPLRL